MKEQARLIFSIIVVILVVIFSIQNTNAVKLDLVFVSFQTPLVLVILFSLLVGVVIGIVSTYSSHNHHRARVKNLEQALKTQKADYQKQLQEKNDDLARLSRPDSRKAD